MTLWLNKLEHFVFGKFSAVMSKTRGQCYKTFYSRNLQIFVMSQSVCHSKPFQPSLMIADSTGAYPSETSFRCSTLR